MDVHEAGLRGHLQEVSGAGFACIYRVFNVIAVCCSRRPYLASQCDNLKEAERWRRQIIREISKKVADIQNGACCSLYLLLSSFMLTWLLPAGSSEHVIRDLNDEINKRIREKRHWERRIVQLGGPDYSKSQPQAYDADGTPVSSVGGYKYFGAAKNLPGVRELFQTEEIEPRKRTRQDMYKHIEPDYYGFRDDEDEQQLKDEEEAENRLRQRAIDGWNTAEAKRKAQVAELQKGIPTA
ncbi:hypothetical protein F441_04872 [Phytophthora nicotianae CJ01A1]|uniref:Pre-mRNA-splicing factor ISY1 n=5 Tax=Phytophthora nicotianae TaxID=4792 RepID=V9FLD2_PHYNI|nr:hypothetical protein F443_04876 [Phytophthora nicotianae P1569]ETK91750.1 hypothetical protein L915_04742 [Phytophthora nicotianae]ETO80613.1 hypothetical protein F444_04914 [Phytophthora nicotianae P1976]ETP21642.1 hypothetical protein F441_04872 [Phytophthora nicotianae CJ01A1]ETP49535.1 hypothetical protein F442_04943 [Phytophthora nicotianae P10297]